MSLQQITDARALANYARYARRASRYVVPDPEGAILRYGIAMRYTPQEIARITNARARHATQSDRRSEEDDPSREEGGE